LGTLAATSSSGKILVSVTQDCEVPSRIPDPVELLGVALLSSSSTEDEIFEPILCRGTEADLPLLYGALGGEEAVEETKWEAGRNEPPETGGPELEGDCL